MTAQEYFYDGPLPGRARLAEAMGGPTALRRAEALVRSRTMDRLALSVVVRLAAARRADPDEAELRAPCDAAALAAYRHAGLACLSFAAAPAHCSRRA
ncbi:MAG: hypothetical protein R3316_03000 [Rhodovibrionaceae bacterium]|nr:hypothetical protein [Rhodovibrionaceae bacterium]